jgi:hypothetical protein
MTRLRGDVAYLSKALKSFHSNHPSITIALRMDRQAHNMMTKNAERGNLEGSVTHVPVSKRASGISMYAGVGHKQFIVNVHLITIK